LHLVSYAYMPSPLPRQVRWSLFALPSPSSAAFPVKKSGRLLQLLFRSLLSVHFTLRPARSRSRLATLSIESSDSFVASAAVSIATGWSEPVPGRELRPLKSSAFSRRAFSPTTIRFPSFRVADYPLGSCKAANRPQPVLPASQRWRTSSLSSYFAQLSSSASPMRSPSGPRM
jgi:hypothetical protein